MTASRAWQPGALRQAIIEVQGAKVAERGPGLSARSLVRETGWSVASVRRELELLQQLGLIGSWTTRPPAMWALTLGGEILWLLAHDGEQRTPVLAQMLGQPGDRVHAETARLVQLRLVRGRPDSETRAWRLAGKTAGAQVMQA